jgi:ATP phosphoribosyltransferase regulatory subunit
MMADMAKAAGLEGESLKDALLLIKEKNLHGLSALFAENAGLNEAACEALLMAAGLSGKPSEVIAHLKALGAGADALAQLSMLAEGFEKLGLSDMLSFDMSAECGTRYYSGVVFKGYISGLPSAVLSGGRYDALSSRMGKKYGNKLNRNII